MSNTSGLTPNWVVRNVPPDIWRSIFNLLLGSMPLKRSEGIKTLLHLTHVCPQWRFIASDSPGLWSTIHVVVSGKGKVFPNEDLLSLILRNARSTPLVMELEVKGSIKPEPRHLNPLKLFLQEAHRAKKLKLHCSPLKTLLDEDYRAFFDIFMGLQRRSLPKLEKLILDLV
ncbi:hypothetical protein CVT26_009608 [Gymnopilus dilepis]|uniref:Uncharacterized protein n=1 Tax=Gymnopilus dilepis TaxID=231916 RepID=A0A409YIK1_9AGAR|nr:hypothetical protein CVT26_009608 [Gymnopilus dilepis]